MGAHCIVPSSCIASWVLSALSAASPLPLCLPGHSPPSVYLQQYSRCHLEIDDGKAPFLAKPACCSTQGDCCPLYRPIYDDTAHLQRTNVSYKIPQI